MAFEAGRQSRERARPIYEAAIASFEKAQGIWEGLVQGRPKVPEEYQYRLAAVANNLGAVLRSTDQLDAATRSFDTARTHYEKLVAVYPEVTSYQIGLAGTYDNLSFLANTTDKPEESLAWSRKAIPILQALRTREPNNANLLQTLRNASWNEAESLTKLGRHTEALPAWDRTIQAATGTTRDELRLLRAQTLARAGDHAGATSDVTVVPDGAVPGYDEFLAAGVFALATAAARDDANLSTTDRERLVEQYAGKALEWLGQAKARGYFGRPDRLDRLKTSPNLEPLRGRGTFSSSWRL
jgi:tetratricopeptide (TPR) repeat protein